MGEASLGGNEMHFIFLSMRVAYCLVAENVNRFYCVVKVVSYSSMYIKAIKRVK
jgi:hypothetical protein